MYGSLTTVLLFAAFVAQSEYIDVPKFGEPIGNVTIPVGREATLVCVVDDLASYKVAWLKVDTQTILTIHGHVITKNHRIGVTHSDHRTWYLHIKDVKQSDCGWYMCQINTDPMKSQVGFLDVVVPPDILDYPTSTDIIAKEGTNVTLRCAASGSPTPSITWRREDGETIPLGNGRQERCVGGSVLHIPRATRLHMGAYLCIASNGVPPSVSKRIMLVVQFPPMIWIQNQLVTAQEGQRLTIECHSEGFPKSISYWTRDRGEIIANGAKYETVTMQRAYKVHMKLSIRAVTASDYGLYRCVSKNSLGDAEGSVRIYPLQISRYSTSKPRYSEKHKYRSKYSTNAIGDASSLEKQVEQSGYDDLEDASYNSGRTLVHPTLVFVVTGMVMTCTIGQSPVDSLNSILRVLNFIYVKNLSLREVKYSL